MVTALRAFRESEPKRRWRNLVAAVSQAAKDGSNTATGLYQRPHQNVRVDDGSHELPVELGPCLGDVASDLLVSELGVSCRHASRQPIELGQDLLFLQFLKA